MQDAGARRVSNAEGIRTIVRKHDCALPAQYTKHSNARGHSLGLGLEEVFVFDSKSENRDRAVEAVESVPEARAV